MKKEKGVFIYVAPSFRHMLKIESARRGESMVNLTRSIAKSNSLLRTSVDEGVNDEKQRKPFMFRF